MLAKRRTDEEATAGQQQVGLPIMGAVRTDPTPTARQDGDWILPLIKAAQERVMSQKEAVLTMGVAKTQYIENLQGTGHLSVRRLGLLPQAFWEALIDELRVHFRMDDDAERLDRAFECVQRGMQQIQAIARKGIK
jgi:hypothetical protein